MAQLSTHSKPLLVVIGKTRTQIWNKGADGHHRPFVIYDPKSRPQFHSSSGPKSTSNYDVKETSVGSRANFRLFTGWMKPTLDPHYCEFIFHHIKEFDQIVIFGGGIGRWSGVNNFESWANLHHPSFSSRITYVRSFRLKDYSEEKLRKLFRGLS